MITLGLHDGHCASVALFENDKLLAVIEEERNFWRPFLCEDKKLNYMDVMQHKVKLDNEIYPLEDIISIPTTQNVMQMRKHFVSKFLDIPENNVFFVDHHKCHANHALFGSQIKDDCLVITMDLQWTGLATERMLPWVFFLND